MYFSSFSLPPGHFIIGCKLLDVLLLCIDKYSFASKKVSSSNNVAWRTIKASLTIEEPSLMFLL